MRISGVLILVVVISMAVVVFLQSRDVTAKREALAIIATELQEEGVDGRRFDRARALELITELEGLAADPDTIASHIDDLKIISETAAGWAAGAASPSPELHASVALRSAAGELRRLCRATESNGVGQGRLQTLPGASRPHTTTPGDGTTAPSGLATEGVQDRLRNLEAAQKERALEVEEELGP